MSSDFSAPILYFTTWQIRLSPLPRIQCLPTSYTWIGCAASMYVSLSPLPRIQCLPTYARIG